MKTAIYDKHIRGYSLLDACIVNESFFAFTAQLVPDTGLDASDDDYDYPTRVITIKDGVVGDFSWDGGFKYPKLIHTGDNGYLITSWEGRAKETRDTPKIFPQYTLDTPEFRDYLSVEITIECLRRIGDSIYASGDYHKLFKRVGKKQWVDLTKPSEHTELHELGVAQSKGNYSQTLPSTFMSFDGFSESDIYACGGEGDLWHYDGQRWTQLSPPINSELNNLVCGDDGFVYITSSWGDLLKGYYRDGEEQWELIPQDVVSMDLGFEDAAWFKGKLYLSNSWGLYVLEEGTVKRIDFSNEGHNAQYSFKRVVAGHGILISYGLDNAVMFDGQQWQAIINPHNLES